MSKLIDKQKVKNLAFAECANHSREMNGSHNWCLAREDHTCAFASDEKMPRCGYYERAVLPLEPELRAVYLASRRAAALGHVLTPLQAEIAREAVRSTGGRRHRTA